MIGEQPDIVANLSSQLLLGCQELFLRGERLDCTPKFFLRGEGFDCTLKVVFRRESWQNLLNAIDPMIEILEMRGDVGVVHRRNP